MPAWLTDFGSANEIVNRSFRDRTGDFYLRGFWNLAGAVAERPALPGEADPRLSALRRAHSFWRAFSITTNAIAIRSAGSLPTLLRLPPEALHDSVANARSRHVNRYLHHLDDADRRATVHGVKLAEQTLPQRPWADSPDNAFTWFTLCREAKPSEVFVVLPKSQPLDGRSVAIDLSLPPRAKAFLLTSRTSAAPCVAYWTDAVPDHADVPCTLELEDRPGWTAGIVVLDPRTGTVCGTAAVKKREAGRLVIAAPAASQPRLLLNRNPLTAEGVWR